MKNSNYLTVGEVSKILGVNRDTILYYDREGVISSIREDNNYRYYHKNQIANFKIIMNFKKIGFSLEEIKKVKGYFRERDYSIIMKLMDKKEKMLLNEIEEKKKNLKLLKSNKKMVEYMNEITSLNFNNIELDDENYRILIKKKKFFCVKDLEEEKGVYVDISNCKENYEEYIKTILGKYKNAKNLMEQYLYGFTIPKENFEKLEDKKEKFVLRVQIDIYKDKYIFPKGKYAILYLDMDIIDEEAIKMFYKKLKENNCIPCGELYIENTNIFDEKVSVQFVNPNKTKLKILKILIKN